MDVCRLAEAREAVGDGGGFQAEDRVRVQPSKRMHADRILRPGRKVIEIRAPDVDASADAAHRARSEGHTEHPRFGCRDQ